MLWENANTFCPQLSTNKRQFFCCEQIPNLSTQIMFLRGKLLILHVHFFLTRWWSAAVHGKPEVYITMAQMIKNIVSDNWWIISCYLGLDAICMSIFNVPSPARQIGSSTISTHLSWASLPRCQRAAENIKRKQTALLLIFRRNAGHFQVSTCLCAPLWPQCNLHRVN